MITVHKFKGQTVWVNPDLIAFAEKGLGGQDLMLTLVDGKHILVTDTAEELAQAISTYRAKVLALAFQLDAANRPLTTYGDEGFPLRAVPDPES
jgi:uncharacterized protein YlzI (FlbEa/FlbD family)